MRHCVKFSLFALAVWGAAPVSQAFAGGDVFTIGGAIYTDLGNPLLSGLAGVEVNVDGTQGSFSTVTGTVPLPGFWQIPNVLNGTWTVTPKFPNYCFWHVVGGVVGDAPPITIVVNLANQAPNQSLQFLAKQDCPCGDRPDCDDGDKCTTDSCVDDMCVHNPIPDCCNVFRGESCPGKCDVCDPVTNTCVKGIPDCCDSNAQCPGKFGVCDLGTNTCVRCGSDTAGDCLEPNGTPFCEDEACCDKICAGMPRCCDREWDALCAASAQNNPTCRDCECALDLGATYAGGILTMNFSLGSDVPSTYHLWLIAANQVFPLWAIPIPEVCPPVAFDLDLPLPCVGPIVLVTALADGSQILCFDVQSLETCPPSAARSSNAAAPAPVVPAPGMMALRRVSEQRHPSGLWERTAKIDNVKTLGRGVLDMTAQVQALIDLLGVDAEAEPSVPADLIVDSRWADFDDSGDVGLPDLLSVLAVSGRCAGCPEDLDGSGDVDLADLLAVLSAWGPSEAAPE